MTLCNVLSMHYLIKILKITLGYTFNGLIIEMRKLRLLRDQIFEKWKMEKAFMAAYCQPPYDTQILPVYQKHKVGQITWQARNTPSTKAAHLSHLLKFHSLSEHAHFRMSCSLFSPWQTLSSLLCKDFPKLPFLAPSLSLF